MHRIVIKQARPGMCLARAIPNPRQPQSKLLSAGITLTAQHIALLHEMAAYDLWIHYPDLSFLDDHDSPDLTSPQRRIIQALQQSLLRHAPLNTPLIEKSRPLIEELIQTLLGNPALQPVLSSLATVDEGLLGHSADVCALGVLLGTRLQDYIIEQRRRLTSRQARELVNLALGCLLHDVGELQLPDGQRESRFPSAIDPQRSADWKQHAELGYLALRHVVEPSAANIVLHHHQHFDGSGFAVSEQRELKLAGSAIHIFSRIAAAADIFQHLLHSFPIPYPDIHALWKMQRPPFCAWCDPMVRQALLDIVPPFVPGMVVTLSDNRQAIVTHIDKNTPCYPRVQVLRNLDDVESQPTPEVLDLTRTPNCQIVAVEGSPVESFLYGPRSAPVQSSQSRISA